MKRLLPLFSLLFLSAILQAQTLKIDVKKPNEDAAYKEGVAQLAEWRKKLIDTAGLVQSKAYLVNPKPGIHRLLQDNMPCLVPDLNATVAVPNAWAGKMEVPFSGKSPRIPNPAKPLNLSPSRTLLITSEKDSNTK